MATEPFPLVVPAGVVKSVSDVTVQGRFIDADKVRFNAEHAEKIGGWTKYYASTFVSICRGALGWISGYNDPFATFGTSHKLYTIGGGTLNDVTPLRESGNLTNPFTTTSGSAVVSVADTSHGLVAGAYVHFSGATAVGGITVNGQYTVTSLTSANAYTITHTSAATSSAGPGGGTVAYQYEINPGLVSTIPGLGFGAGPFGDDYFGTARSASNVGIGNVIELRYWCIRRYGSYIMASPSNGGIYYSATPDTNARMVVVAGAPTNVRAFFVTSERYIFALGASGGSVSSGGSMTLAWPDIDDITDWVPALDNTANERVLQSGSKLINGTIFGTINLIWSDTSLYLAQFLPGDAEIYRTEPIATGCGLIAPGAFAVTPVGVFWMSKDNIFVYSGGQVVPAINVDDIRDHVFKNLSQQAVGKVSGFWNPKFNEVWFEYPSVDTPDGENDSYAALQLGGTFPWTIGTLPRSSSCYIETALGILLMFGNDSYIYRHEYGKDADGAAMEAFAAHGMIPLETGANDIDVGGYVPDFQRQNGIVTLTIETWDRPMDVDPLETEDHDIPVNKSLVDMRHGGRYVSLKYTSNEVGGDFRLGTPLLELGQVPGDHR